jgi:hypothetical protein
MYTMHMVAGGRPKECIKGRKRERERRRGN